MIYDLVLLMGILGVASNPSPYYGALGLVVGAGAGCFMLMKGGMTFLCLVLFIIYLGGMMVVFAYSAALVGESDFGGFDWGGFWGYVVGYTVVLVGGCLVWWAQLGGEDYMMTYDEEYSGMSGEWWGVSAAFNDGGWMLLLGSWALLVTLVGVVKVVWGRYSGVLRAL